MYFHWQYSLQPYWTSGFRICPGQYLVLSALFLNFACTVSAFDISKATDENGNVITPSGEYTSGFTMLVLVFNLTPMELNIFCFFSVILFLLNAVSSLVQLKLWTSSRMLIQLTTISLSATRSFRFHFPTLSWVPCIIWSCCSVLVNTSL